MGSQRRTMAEMLHPTVRRSLALLDAQPAGAVVLDGHGHAWQLGSVGGDCYWYRAYGDESSTSSWDIAERGPFTVLEPSA